VKASTGEVRAAKFDGQLATRFGFVSDVVSYNSTSKVSQNNEN